MASHYYSRGKLMISGEYLVLHGAEALAVPVKFGQSLEVRETSRDHILSWKTLVKGNPWLSARFSLPELELIDKSNTSKAIFLLNLLKAAKTLNKSFLANAAGLQVNSHIDFDIDWGLGSSSSLISNVAWWAGIDPLDLHYKVSKGSGYDVVCARASKAVLYKVLKGLSQVAYVNFQPAFSDKIYFIYLGQKKDSQTDVDIFLSEGRDFSKEIKVVSNLSKRMAVSNTYDEFAMLMREHEDIISGVLGRPKLKKTLFADFPGEIKSLGAWGGDFAMALWPHEKTDLKNYLRDKELSKFFNFNDLIYHDENK